MQLNGREILIKIRVNVMDPIVWFCDEVSFIILKPIVLSFCFVSGSSTEFVVFYVLSNVSSYSSWKVWYFLNMSDVRLRFVLLCETNY